MTKVRVLKDGGYSGRKYQAGDEINVKSTLVDALVKDGRVELVDEAPTKKRAGTRSAGGPRGRGRRA